LGRFRINDDKTVTLDGHGRTHSPGVNIDIVVNRHARRGSAAVAEACARALPEARVFLSSSTEESARFVRQHDSGRSSLLVSAGGDGTALGMVNARRTQVLTLGLLPLGTGNGWAGSSNAPRWREGVERLGLLHKSGQPAPLSRYRLVEILGENGAGLLAHFAGTGWDAEIINDFRAQKDGLGVLPRAWRRGVAGYLQGVFTRAVPRHLRSAAPEVEVTNLGSPALCVDDAGNAVPLAGGEAGQVIYRGPANVCGVGTQENWGFGFRAFPSARLRDDRFCLRVYGGSAAEAVVRMGRLWRGEPVAKMHSFLVDRIRCTFSRPVPFQAGGDPLGERQEVEYRLATETVDVLDWARLAA
jgi:diacylglycerol kinase family enzyme